MDDDQFDSALIGSAMAQAETLGWRHVTVAAAAREAGLALDLARTRFPHQASVLVRLGVLADQAALVDDGSTGTVRERLFDMLMRRFDVLQQYRGGVQTVMRALPFDPALVVMLAFETRTSMAWMAQASGLDTGGLAGSLRITGLVGVWLQTLRAWERDDSPDLSGTMAALDRALDRAASLGRFLGGRLSPPPEITPEVPVDAVDPDGLGLEGLGPDEPFAPGPVISPG